MLKSQMNRNSSVQSDFRAACACGASSPAPFHGCVIPWGLEGTAVVSEVRKRVAAPYRFALRAGHLPSSLFCPSLSLNVTCRDFDTKTEEES